MAVYHLCRICLTEGTNTEAMQPLFDNKNARCAEIVRQIEECGGIVLRAHEEFPKMICDQCLHSLDTSYKFRSMCQASEHALLDAIVKTETHEEPQIESIKFQNETEIFFDLRTEIIDAEEVDLDMLADKHEFQEDSLIDYVEETSDISDTTELVIKQEPRAKKSTTKKTSEAGADVVPKKRGRPKLKTLTLSNNADPNIVKTEKIRKIKSEISDQIMCELCGNIYAKRSMLNMHMRRHLAEKPFECEICKKTFACPSEIRRHMRVHTGEKPFVCKYCGRTFADRSTNIKHERIHTKERPFSCHTCGKSFTYSNVLKNHMLTHTGEKPFGCVPCNRTFSRKHQLDQHYATLTHQHTIKNLTAPTIKIDGTEIIIVPTEQSNDERSLNRAVVTLANGMPTEQSNDDRFLNRTDVTLTDGMPTEQSNDDRFLNRSVVTLESVPSNA